jgi:mono/diheme cytochrome c family protein
LGRFIAGLIIGLIAIPVFAWLYIRFGYAPVATAAPPFPLERRLAKMALNARISKEAPKEPPTPPSELDYAEAAGNYRQYCSVCHGLPGQEKTPTAKGMYPPPPQLFHGKGVTDDPAGETYWKVSNGIRLTGMPAYGGSLSDRDIWNISELLAHADKLPPAVTTELSKPPAAK